MITEEPFDTSLVPPGLLAVDLEALAAEHGTPLFVYDEDDLRARCREYVSHLGEGCVAYASKAFLCSAMARLVAEEGLHLDVATGGELHVALRAGVPPERIVVHGNNKSIDELRMALDAGVGRIVVDSFDEIDRLDALTAETPARPSVLVRVTPGVEAHTHEFIETGTEASKFGFTVTDDIALEAVRRVVAHERLELAGLHCHIGSQIYRIDSYTRAVEILAALAVRVRDEVGATLDELNLGGGLGARYLADDPLLEVADYAKTVRSGLEQSWAEAGLGAPPRLVVEPGRSIVPTR